VTSTGGGTSSLSVTPGAQFSGNLDLAFASFVGTADFSDIASISLEIDGPFATDVIMNRIVAVPEPGTAVALGVGLAGLAWLGRRRTLLA
jgi:hypothetical protein